MKGDGEISLNTEPFAVANDPSIQREGNAVFCHLEIAVVF